MKSLIRRYRHGYKKETLRVWIAAQNATIKTNYFKAKINMHLNSKCRLCSDTNKKINHIRESSKLVQQEYKSRLDSVRKVIYSKKLKSDHTTKWFMHKLESILENGMHKIFEIQTVYLICQKTRSSDRFKEKKTTSIKWILTIQRTKE